MRRYENDCCGCATPQYPCRGSACGLRHNLHFYCDECGDDCDPDDMYEYDGEELCEDCLLKRFDKISY